VYKGSELIVARISVSSRR